MDKATITITIKEDYEHVEEVIEYMRDQIENEWGYVEGNDFTIKTE